MHERYFTMASVRTFLSKSVCSSSQLAEFTLTTLGILSLVVGLFILPTLELNETGFYIGLLSLVTFMVLCFCAGQLVVIRDRSSNK